MSDMTALPANMLAEEIRELHAGLMDGARVSLQTATKIGELLVDVKSSLPHGEWVPWICENLPFGDRTARNYIRIWENRDALKSETVSDLTSAYRLLCEPKKAKNLPAFSQNEGSGVTGKRGAEAADAGDASKLGQQKSQAPARETEPLPDGGQRQTAAGDLAAGGTLSPPVGISRPDTAKSPLETSPQAQGSRPDGTHEAESGTRQPATPIDEPTPGDLAGQAVALLMRIPLDHPDRRGALFYVMDWILEHKCPAQIERLLDAKKAPKP